MVLIFIISIEAYLSPSSLIVIDCLLCTFPCLCFHLINATFVVLILILSM